MHRNSPRAGNTAATPRRSSSPSPRNPGGEARMPPLSVNGKPVSVDAEADTPLLWVLRDFLDMTGTKFGCGMALCGACTVHVDGKPARSCQTPLSAVTGRRITTIEGIGFFKVCRTGPAAWVAENVPQCGYCQSGQAMSATALLNTNKVPADDQLDAPV